MITFDHVTKTYFDGLSGIHDVTFSVGKGEFVFLTGESGAGKTTIIKLILGEIRPDSGEIYVDNFNVGAIRSAQIPKYRRTIGVVFQDYLLIPTKTVWENVQLALDIAGVDEDTTLRRVRETLISVNMLDKKDSFPCELSGGEKQRTVIARAIANYPSFILADEPTGNLDENRADEIMDIFHELNKNGQTIIMATHDRRFIKKASHRILTLEKGVLQSE